MILKVPPENIWPSGPTPPELAASLHASGQLTPEEARHRVVQEQGIEKYQPPLRPAPNLAELQAERSLHLVEQPPPVQSAPILQRMNGQHYRLPLSREVSAEIVIHGSPTTADFKLLQRYVRLMSSADFAVVAPVPIPPPRAALVMNGKRPRKQRATGT